MSPTFDAEPAKPGAAMQAFIRQTARRLEQIQVPTGRDCVGLRLRAERLTKR